MNIKNKLNHISIALGSARRMGKTTLIAKACKDLDGIMLGANHQHAKMLEYEHGVTAKSIDMNLQGFRGPFFIDHYAMERLLQRAVSKIEALEEENKALQTEKENLEYKVMELMLDIGE
jgi:hypothetical protein